MGANPNSIKMLDDVTVTLIGSERTLSLKVRFASPMTSSNALPGLAYSNRMRFPKVPLHHSFLRCAMTARELFLRVFPRL